MFIFAWYVFSHVFFKPSSILKKMSLFNKVSGYKTNIQKSVVFLYTNNELSEKNKENNPIYDSIKNNKILRINLTKEIKGLYIENYKTLIK